VPLQTRQTGGGDVSIGWPNRAGFIRVIVPFPKQASQRFPVVSWVIVVIVLISGPESGLSGLGLRRNPNNAPVELAR
jgi:hypothetical protein